jgi:predicted neuraminidase
MPSSREKSEFIFDSAPFAACHASTIVELRGGELMAAWFGGSGEGRTDVAIWTSRKSGGRWSTPVELVREPRVPTWNPVLFHSRDNRLWLYYKFGKSPSAWHAARMWSDDEGKTWSKPERLPSGIYGPIRAKPLVLDNGMIVSGTSVERGLSWTAWVEQSSDNGKTWTRIGPIALSAQGVSSPATNADEPYGIIQPSIISVGEKHLRLYARSSSHIARICTAESFDEGKNWTAAKPIDLPNPNSGVDAVSLLNLGVILIFNHSSSKRTPLNLAVSKDGEHFRMFATLEDQPGEYSYPAMIVGSDGALHITYTWNRKKIRYVRFRIAEIPQS